MQPSFVSFPPFVSAARVLTLVAALFTLAPSTLAQHALSSNTVSVASLRVPEKAREHLERARKAILDGSDSDFEREIAKALALEPNYAEAWLLRAVHDVKIHLYDQALTHALEAHRIDPTLRGIAVVRASACNGLHRFDEAEALIKSLTSAEAATWTAHYELTRALIGLAKTDEALEASALTLQSVPEGWLDNAHLLRANALQLAHRYQEAIIQLQAYLDSPRPQPLRARVLEVIQNDRQNMTQDEVSSIATH
jgi:tetratricopeptide (TPR) repeat protein